MGGRAADVARAAPWLATGDRARSRTAGGFRLVRGRATLYEILRGDTFADLAQMADAPIGIGERQQSDSGGLRRVLTSAEGPGAAEVTDR